MQSLCSWSLVELYRAFGSSVDAHKAVLAAHPMYANLMERVLAKVVLQHVTTLEKFCQVFHVAVAYVNSKYCVFLQVLQICVHEWMSPMSCCLTTTRHIPFCYICCLSPVTEVSLDTNSAKGAWHGPSLQVTASTGLPNWAPCLVSYIANADGVAFDAASSRRWALSC